MMNIHTQSLTDPKHIFYLISDSYCPDGWARFIGSCYYLSDSSSKGLRYDAAKRSCEYKLSYLATVDSALEKNIVFKTL